VRGAWRTLRRQLDTTISHLKGHVPNMYEESSKAGGGGSEEDGSGKRKRSQAGFLASEQQAAKDSAGRLTDAVEYLNNPDANLVLGVGPGEVLVCDREVV
jgi:hypothetical protein